MTLNKSKGNMYNFITHTWNTISGRCHHNCDYCFNLGKPFFEGELRLNEKNLKDNLGKGNFIFVGSSNDLFQEDVPKEWIIKTLEHCKKFPENTYLFQTKNPMRFTKLRDELISFNCILGTTIETDRNELLKGNAPKIEERSNAMTIKGFRKFITIEPIIDFNVRYLADLIERTNPEFVAIGADSKNHKLVEPSKEKVESLIKELKKFTQVKIKDNLRRLR